MLSGRERIDFVNRGPAELDRVWLRLWANGPDRCEPRRIRVEVDAPALAGSERVRCSALEVQLRRRAGARSDGVDLAELHGPRPRSASDRFGRIGNTVLLGNVIPLLAVEDAGGLHLEPYTPIGESFYSLSAAGTRGISLPARLRAATTGAVSPGEVGSASAWSRCDPPKRVTSGSPSAPCAPAARARPGCACGSTTNRGRAESARACATPAAPFAR